MLSITVAIGPFDLGMAENDYSRFALQHFLEQKQSWDILDTTTDPFTATVAARVDGLSPFALTVVTKPDVDGQTAVIPEVPPTATKSPLPLSTAHLSPMATAVIESSSKLPPTANPTFAPTATAVPTPMPILVPTATAVLTPTPSPLRSK